MSDGEPKAPKIPPPFPFTTWSEMGRAGGKRGGVARAAKLTEQRRREIARLGGVARQYGSPKRKESE